MEFQSQIALPLLIAVPAVLALGMYAIRQRRRSRERFSDRTKRSGEAIPVVLHSLGALALVLALARPYWDKEPIPVEKGGRDILFLLDVSRSMLASDIRPSRLDSAKSAIRDCLESLEGHRVGLVTFAGSPSIACPMTTDYGFFRNMLDEASPENVSQGGTRIGDALRKSADKLLSTERAGLQDVILISDGGDQESLPEKAAGELEPYGVFLLGIGVGDETTGARVPARNGNGQFTRHQGQEVWSKLEADSLRAMTEASPDGAYLHAGTRAMDLGEIYLDLARHRSGLGIAGMESMLRPKDRFPLFLGAALACFLGAFLFPWRSRIRTPRTSSAIEPARPARPVPKRSLTAATGVWVIGLGVILVPALPLPVVALDGADAHGGRWAGIARIRSPGSSRGSGPCLQPGLRIARRGGIGARHRLFFGLPRRARPPRPGHLQSGDRAAQTGGRDCLAGSRARA